MSPNRIGPIAQAWYKWKSLRLPWRKNFLVGFDLQGNTYWEFRLTRGNGNGAGSGPQQQQGEERWRRIVKYPRSTYYSEVKVSPQWHQWLRHMRRDPPPLEEQRNEMIRQARMRQLAAAADARWEAKPRLVGEASHEQQELPFAQQDTRQETRKEADDQDKTQHREAKAQQETANDPWARARAQGPGENWQPTAWNPNATKNR